MTPEEIEERHEAWLASLSTRQRLERWARINSPGIAVGFLMALLIVALAVAI